MASIFYNITPETQSFFFIAGFSGRGDLNNFIDGDRIFFAI